jgi:hypothetical protein
MVAPSQANSTVVSARIPNGVLARFDERLRTLGIQRQHAIELAVAALAELADPVIRNALKPAWRALAASPELNERMLSSGIQQALRFHVECPGRQCPDPKLRAPSPVRTQVEVRATAPAVKPCSGTCATAAAKPAKAAPKAAPDPLAGLADFELRDAQKITDPTARARFIASRLERKTRRK